MNIINWDFPEFEDWYNDDKEWCGKIGEYNCSIKIISWMKDNMEYMCAISTHIIPTNIFANKIISYSKTIKDNDIDELRNWYNKTINCVKNEWIDYIKKTYIQVIH